MQIGNEKDASNPGSLGTAPFGKGEEVRHRTVQLGTHIVQDVKPIKVGGKHKWYVRFETTEYFPADQYEPAVIQ